MKSCILCLNLTLKKNLLNTETQQECGETIQDIIKQHFWFADRIIHSEEKEYAICKSCWMKLENFNEFFCAVKFNYHIAEDEEETIVTEALDETVDFEASLESSLNYDLLGNDPTVEKLSEVEETIEDPEDTSKLNEDDLEVSNVRKRSFERLSEDSPLKSPKVQRLCQSLSQEDFNAIKEFTDTKCEICSKDLTSWVETRVHFRKFHNAIPFVRCCNKKLEKPSELKEHIEWHRNPDKFTCKTCGKLLVSKCYLMLHEAKHVPTEDRTFSCPKCQKMFGSSHKLRLHESIHKDDHLEETVPCPQCPDKKFKTKKRLQLHFANVHDEAGSYLCHLCPKVMNTKQRLEDHVRNHSEPSATPLECKLCGRFLKNHHRLKIHMHKHDQANKGPYPCPKCDKAYKHKASLSAHVAYVHTSKKFKCPHCEKVFKHQANLNEHLSQHTGVDNYSCPFCDRTFKSNANMYKHKKRMHLKEQPRDLLEMPRNEFTEEQ